MASNPPPEIFNRKTYARRRARAAAGLDNHDFLHRRAMVDVVSRLELVTRKFPRALFYGAGHVISELTPDCGVGAAFEADLAQSRLSPHADAALIYDEELSPFAPQSFDLVVSLLTLHHANDLVGALAQMRMALKPDGLMIAVLFGEDTLRELRHVLYGAESEITGGVSPRIAPFASVRDLGAALQRAGFALPVADVDNVDVAYRKIPRLLADIRGMGEASILRTKGRGLRRDALGLALSKLEDVETIRFDLVTLTGWAPDKSQQKPLKRGSAKLSLEEAIKQTK